MATWSRGQSGRPGLNARNATLLGAASSCLLLGAIGALAGQNGPPERNLTALATGAETSADADGKPASDYLLDRGDKLRIRFFDRYDRDDLNGDHLIGESGKLRLPRLGLFEVRNKTTSELEQAVRESAERRGEKLGYFYIEIVECRPIYVSGLANRPGAYPFTAGLTVMHAVALAGGIYRSAIMSPGESMRERSKVSETLEKLKEPLARKARLEAEAAGSDTIQMPAELVELDPASAKSFVEREQFLLQRAREKDARERASLQNMIAFSQTEVDSFDEEIATMNQRIAEQTQLFERLKSLYNQKIVNASQFNQSLTALDSVQRDKQLAIAGVARAKAALEKAKKDLAMVTLTSRSGVAKELAEVDATISQLRSMADGQRRLASRLEIVAGRASDENELSYRIMRKSMSGAIISMPATETTPLMPGDVIQVETLRQGPRLTSK